MARSLAAARPPAASRSSARSGRPAVLLRGSQATVGAGGQEDAATVAAVWRIAGTFTQGATPGAPFLAVVIAKRVAALNVVQVEVPREGNAIMQPEAAVRECHQDGKGGS
jgi:hypothetical protein